MSRSGRGAGRWSWIIRKAESPVHSPKRKYRIDGVSELIHGVSELIGGVLELIHGVSELIGGVLELIHGVSELFGGVSKLIGGFCSGRGV